MHPTTPAAADAASQQPSSSGSGSSAASHAAAPTSASGNGMQPPITATAATAAPVVAVPPSGQNDSTTAPATAKGMSSSSPLTAAAAAAAATSNAAAAAPSTAASLAPSSSSTEAASYEETHVHAVYESIAPHFSATRYKPWPVIADFLTSLAPGSIGFDVGCGNGKYLGVNPGVHILGSDRSASLVRFARDHGGVERSQDVAVADGLSLPFPEGRADFAICVAVIHHMSTRERRREAVRALLDCVRKPPDGQSGGGEILVYVWALEQSGSRRGWDEGTEQDLLVPWVMKQKKEKKEKKTKTKAKAAAADQEGKDAAGIAEEGKESAPGPAVAPSETTYQRYYHLFRKGELEEDVEAVGGKVVRNGYDKDNWWVVASRCS
ncbi:tRNA (carboxymethyluridine(34)-5-O)-methyltransferase [Apiospora kogelbergensis]|uniref:tRNA (carboxymethyluridine(34)-5-O)-methyltransferase n=1 Tax=Apiospora kogelbergensis TaxID=1337665 RepID=UPI0031310FC9